MKSRSYNVIRAVFFVALNLLPLKMNVAGNSFLFLFDLFPSKEEAVFLCGKNQADGVVYLEKRGKNYGYSLLNSDGSKTKFCGNATMCVARYLFDSGFERASEFTIATDSGIKKVTVFGKLECKKVRLEVGKPHFQRLFPYSGNSFLLRLTYKGKRYGMRAFPVWIGNDHLVVFKNRNNGLADETISELVNSSGLFPDGVNLELVHVKKNVLETTVFERGCGKTTACGSGAAAVAFAAKECGYTEDSVVVRFDGGDILTEIKKGRVYITGNPKYCKPQDEKKNEDNGICE